MIYVVFLMADDIYQNLVDALCEIYEVPTIEVQVFKKGELGNAEAMFDTTGGYNIKVVIGASRETVVHEWMHYCIHLIKRVDALEESLCDAIFSGVEVDADGLYPLLDVALRAVRAEDDVEVPALLDGEPEVV